MRNQDDNIEKYYYELVFQKFKRIVNNISICNVIDNIPGLGTNFLS